MMEKAINPKTTSGIRSVAQETVTLVQTEV